jgi:hypothetical protein
MSDTPRTDAAQHNMGSLMDPHYVVDVEFARELERELDRAQKLCLEAQRIAIERGDELIKNAASLGCFVQFDCHFNGDFEKCGKDCALLKVCKRRS